VLSFHGSADPVDPFAGHGQKYWTYSVPSAAAKWAAQDGCAAKPFVTSPATTLTLSTYRACRDGAAVELYELTGEGHEWPDGPTLPPSLTAVLGPQSNALDANQTMWTFFEAHPLSKGATS
jgi:polyhydroxybutyrate depolymerase